jgi:hypothetical protein
MLPSQTINLQALDIALQYTRESSPFLSKEVENLTPLLLTDDTIKKLQAHLLDIPSLTSSNIHEFISFKLTDLCSIPNLPDSLTQEKIFYTALSNELESDKNDANSVETKLVQYLFNKSVSGAILRVSLDPTTPINEVILVCAEDFISNLNQVAYLPIFNLVATIRSNLGRGLHSDKYLAAIDKALHEKDRALLQQLAAEEFTPEMENKLKTHIKLSISIQSNSSLLKMLSQIPVKQAENILQRHLSSQSSDIIGHIIQDIEAIHTDTA